MLEFPLQGVLPVVLIKPAAAVVAAVVAGGECLSQFVIDPFTQQHFGLGVELVISPQQPAAVIVAKLEAVLGGAYVTGHRFKFQAPGVVVGIPGIP